MKDLFICLIILFLSFSAYPQKLTILHTNDHHGHFMEDADGNFGLAQQSTMIKEIEKEVTAQGGHVLKLSAGDVNTGPAASNLNKAIPDFLAMNEIGYQAMVPGNHEFDHPYKTLLHQKKIAAFDFVCANIKTVGGEYAFKPFKTVEVAGKKVAIIGFTTHEIPHITPREHSKGLIFNDPADSRDLVIKLKKKHDYVIALSHLGLYEDDGPSRKYYGDRRLAELIPELDLIVGGHTHTKTIEAVKVGNTYIVQTDGMGHDVGRLDLDLSKSGDKILSYTQSPVKGYKKDPKILKITRPFIKEAKAIFDVKVGEASGEFKAGRGFLDVAEQPLGKMVAEAHRQAVSADFSMLNSKGIRAGLPKGTLTVGHIIAVSPFAGPIATIDLTGEEVWKTIQKMHDTFTVKNDVAYFSPGVELKMNGNKIEQIFINGKNVPNTPTGRYKAAVNNFISDIMPEFELLLEKHPTYIKTAVTDKMALETFIKKRGEVDPSSFTKPSYIPSNGCGQIAKALIELSP